MDTKEIVNGTAAIPTTKKATKEKAGDVDFQQVLNRVASGKGETGQAPSSSSPAGEVELLSSPIFSAPYLNAGANSEALGSIRSEGIQMTERILGLLEEYQKGIGDPKTTLRDLAPLVQSLSEEAGRLRTLADQVPISDPLRKIISELGIVSTVELERFNRGEYI